MRGRVFCDSALSPKLKNNKTPLGFSHFLGNGGSFEITDVQKCVRGRRFCAQLYTLSPETRQGSSSLGTAYYFCRNSRDCRSKVNSRCRKCDRRVQFGNVALLPFKVHVNNHSQTKKRNRLRQKRSFSRPFVNAPFLLAGSAENVVQKWTLGS